MTEFNICELDNRERVFFTVTTNGDKNTVLNALVAFLDNYKKHASFMVSKKNEVKK